jgi:hypothetical protein
MGPSENGMFPVNSIEFAFDNSGDEYKGFEVLIPYSVLGITPISELRAFAFVVSNTAYFSDVSVPGNISGGNPGFNPVFGNIPGGPYHSVFTVVPVELVSFSGTVSGSKVNLAWETASETNNRGFSVERKVKYESPENWKEIAFIPGHGTVTELKKYSYQDDLKNLFGTFQYRLIQMDYDGESGSSEIIEITVDPIDIKSFYLSQNYPNPFNPDTRIEFMVPENCFTELKVYNLLGEEVAVLVNGVKDKGLYEAVFRAEGIPGGVYFYTISAGEYKETRKMLLMK